MKAFSIDKKHYEIDGGGFTPRTDHLYIPLCCYDGPNDEEMINVEIPIPITLDEKWFEKIKEYNKGLKE